MTDRHVPVTHGTVRVRTTGAGPDRVFLHGWPTDGSTWDAVVAHLGEGHRCHQLDLPGAGGRVQGTPRLHLHDHARSVIEVLEALDLRDAVLFGHDSGGAIARFVADQRPDRVAGLVIGGTEIPRLRPWMLYRLKALAWAPGGGVLFRALLGTGWLRRSELLGFGVCFADPRWVDGPFHARTFAPMLQDRDRLSHALAFLRQFDFAAVDSLAQVHARLRCPVLLLWGEHDGLFPLAQARRMCEQFGGPIALQVLPGGRLFAHEDHAETYAARATAWLEQHAPPRRGVPQGAAGRGPDRTAGARG